MVNVDQQRDLERQNQNERDDIIRAVIFWCCCITIVDVEKQYFVNTPSLFQLEYKAHAPCYIITCSVYVCIIFFTLSHNRYDFQKGSF
jgi:hypothetical protein